jgi:hypothetical protein
MCFFNWALKLVIQAPWIPTSPELIDDGSSDRSITYNSASFDRTSLFRLFLVRRLGSGRLVLRYRIP